MKYRLFTLWTETNMPYSNLPDFWPPHCRNALFSLSFLRRPLIMSRAIFDCFGLRENPFGIRVTSLSRRAAKPFAGSERMLIPVPTESVPLFVRSLFEQR
jgi:hypothetical protein